MWLLRRPLRADSIIEALATQRASYLAQTQTSMAHNRSPCCCPSSCPRGCCRTYRGPSIRTSATRTTKGRKRWGTSTHIRPPPAFHRPSFGDGVCRESDTSHGVPCSNAGVGCASASGAADATAGRSASKKSAGGTSHHTGKDVWDSGIWGQSASEVGGIHESGFSPLRSNGGLKGWKFVCICRLPTQPQPQPPSPKTL